MNKKVSIIIPTYNGAKYIKETIDSCLNQSYKNIEIIVVDDCSSDSTVEILKSYENKINLTINKTNQGIVKNLNNMTLGVESEYFIFLGHDDILPINHIEIMIGEFDNDTIALHCNSMGIDGNSNETKLNRSDDKQIQKTDRCMFELSIDNFISSCGMLHRTDIFQKLNGWDDEYKQYGEWLYYIRELEFGNIKYTTKTKAFYRRHETNITNTFKNKDVKRSLNKYKRVCRNLAHNINKNTTSDNIRYYFNEFKLFIKSFK